MSYAFVTHQIVKLNGNAEIFFGECDSGYGIGGNNSGKENDFWKESS